MVSETFSEKKPFFFSVFRTVPPSALSQYCTAGTNQCDFYHSSNDNNSNTMCRSLDFHIAKSILVKSSITLANHFYKVSQTDSVLACYLSETIKWL